MPITLAEAIIRLTPSADKIRFHHEGEKAGDEFAAGARHPLMAVVAGWGRDIRSTLGRAGAGGGAQAAAGVSSAFTAVSGNLTAILAGAAVAAAPAIGAAISGALIGGGGLATIGIAAMLLKDEPALRGAAKQLADTAKATFKGAAAPMLQPMVDALGVFRGLVAEVGPQIRGVFAEIAPAIKPLAEGLAGMVKNSLPGFKDLLAQSAPFLIAFAKTLPELGTAISSFLTSVSKGGPGAIAFFRDFAVFLSGQLVMWGAIIGWLSQAYLAIHRFFADIPGWVSAAIAWFENLKASIAAWVAGVLGWFGALPGRVGAGIAALPGVVAGVFRMMFDAAFNLVGFMIGTVVGLLFGLPTRAGAAIGSLPGRVAAVFGEAVGAARELAGSLVAGAVSVVASLPGRIGAVLGGVRSAVMSAFASAGSWLISAGADIIRGLASGITGAMGSAIDAARRAASDVVSGFKGALGISSPSEVMRREVGRPITSGVGAGIDDMMAELTHRFTIDVRGLARAGAAGAAESGVPGIVRPREEIDLSSWTISRIAQALSARPVNVGIEGPNYLGIGVAGTAR